MSNKHVCNLAMTKCSMGLAPGTLMVLPINRVLTFNQPAATVMDFIPMVNVMPFGMCKSPANPTVAAATAAALGTLTPMPCIPLTVAPWAPGSPTVKMMPGAVLNDKSKLTCTWGGMIEVTFAGQVKEQVP
ncbi:MAG: DUF4280 domain-containing protein [Aquabacterium sp.]